jgi:predicted AAA+ superfamily ATPase
MKNLYYEKLVSYLKENKAVIIVGARQVGKLPCLRIFSIR